MLCLLILSHGLKAHEHALTFQEPLLFTARYHEHTGMEVVFAHDQEKLDQHTLACYPSNESIGESKDCSIVLDTDGPSYAQCQNPM